MMHVKVKSKDVRINIPVPYALFNLAISIYTSSLFQKNLHKWTKEHFERKKMDFTFPIIDKKVVKSLVKDLKSYKGIVLVDVKAQDGTEVKVRL